MRKGSFEDWFYLITAVIFWVVFISFIIFKFSEASQVSKERADAVGEAMRDFQRAQVEHDCKNSVATRKKLKETQENLRVLVRSQQGGSKNVE